MNTCINLLRELIHPQGAGRWVPGCHAATPPLAALRGTRFLAYPIDMSRHSVDQRLAGVFSSLVEWPCIAPCALHSIRSPRFLKVSK
jgi:hypothetical protein